MTARERLREIFLHLDLAWLIERLQRRVQLGQHLTGTVTLTTARTAERRALDDLLGRPATRGSRLTLSLDTLARQLRETGLANDLHEVVTVCCGDVSDRRQAALAKAMAWRSLFETARQRLDPDRAAMSWLRSLESDGLLKRLAKSDPQTGAELLSHACAIWEKLPAGSVTLAEFASNLTGDTHALDRGQPLSPILLRGLRFRTGHDGNQNAESRRHAWEAVGVVVDRLSAPVLTFNLATTAGSALGQTLAIHRREGQPIYLTYQQIQDHGAFEAVSGMEDVFVVENPAIVEAAATQLGSKCRPLICTEGIPASATKRLLRQLAESGSRIHLRADYDWTGLHIVDHLLTMPGTRLWRMDAATYETIPASVPLAGCEFSPDWCQDLVAATRKRGLAGYEEQIVDRLLKDLSTADS